MEVGGPQTASSRGPDQASQLVGWAKSPAAGGAMAHGPCATLPTRSAARSDSVGKGAWQSTPINLLRAMRLCPPYGGGAPPAGVLITIQTIMSQALRMAARSRVSTAAAIRPAR